MKVGYPNLPNLRLLIKKLNEVARALWDNYRGFLGNFELLVHTSLILFVPLSLLELTGLFGLSRWTGVDGVSSVLQKELVVCTRISQTNKETIPEIHGLHHNTGKYTYQQCKVNENHGSGPATSHRHLANFSYPTQ